MSETENSRDNIKYCLDFEKPIVETRQKIEELQRAAGEGAVDLDSEIQRLRRKYDQATRDIFRKLTPPQVVALARHGQRPHTRDYIERLFTDFEELHGDRGFADDAAMVGGMARFRGRPVMLLGHEKGRTVEQRVACNYGMPMPEGYRKAKRLMLLAERFRLPLVCFVDTPGAYPGIDAEQRGQHEAIAASLSCMVSLDVPIIAVIIGEGGSGGALAIALADRVCMQQYAVYSVISPEGCAAILWHDAAKADEAAEKLELTAEQLLQKNVIDTIIEEPPGGAHRDYDSAAALVGTVLQQQLESLVVVDALQLKRQRQQRFMAYGSSAEGGA